MAAQGEQQNEERAMQQLSINFGELRLERLGGGCGAAICEIIFSVRNGISGSHNFQLKSKVSVLPNFSERSTPNCSVHLAHYPSQYSQNNLHVNHT